MNLIHENNKTYGLYQLSKRLLENLEHIGYDMVRLALSDLTFDEYYIIGRKATLLDGLRWGGPRQLIDIFKLSSEISLFFALKPTISISKKTV